MSELKVFKTKFLEQKDLLEKLHSTNTKSLLAQIEKSRSECAPILDRLKIRFGETDPLKQRYGPATLQEVKELITAYEETSRMYANTRLRLNLWPDEFSGLNLEELNSCVTYTMGLEKFALLEKKDNMAKYQHSNLPNINITYVPLGPNAVKIFVQTSSTDTASFDKLGSLDVVFPTTPTRIISRLQYNALLPLILNTPSAELVALPSDVLNFILHYLTIKEAARLSCACKETGRIIKNRRDTTT
eukprot:Platyproteum_vivax@DN6307_c0_g1_i1.p1